MSSRLPADERASKVVEFLKAMGINSDRRIEDIAKECQVSRAAAYNWINAFVRDFVLTDQDPDFPRRLTTIYNQDLPKDSDKLDGEDVERLRHFVDEFYAKNIPPPTDNINMQENPSRTMSYNNVDPTRDTTTEEGYLRSLLMNAKYVNPTQIERFIQQYSMNKEVFDKNPLELLDHMKYMFGPQAGQNIFNLWQKGRGKFVYGTDQQQQGIDPMMFAMMMGGGGNVNPAMLQSMMGGGGNPNVMMNAMLISQMSQQSQRESARREQQEMMERMMQMMMMRFATQAVDDRKPWMEGGGMGMPGMGYQIQEYPDETGKIKYRTYVPNFPGQQMGMGQHQDPIMTMIMGKQMDLTNALVAKMADTGKQPTDLLLGLIPHFKAQGDTGAQMSQMIDVINKVAPGFFTRDQNRGGGLEEAKLKFDTDLAKMAQQIELAKMQHNWRVDEMDRTAANDNAKSWMSTFTTLGDRIVSDIAPAVLKGFGGGMLNKEGPPAPQMNPQLQQQLMMQQQQRAQMAQRQQQEQQAMQAQAQQQPQVDPGTVYMLTALQQQLAQSENNNKILMQRMQEIESQSQNARQQQFSLDEKRLGKMTTGQLSTLLQELQLQNNAESRLKSVIESEIHNRQVIGNDSVIEAQADLPEESSNEDLNKQFNSGEEPMSNEGVGENAEKLEGT